MPIPLAFTPPNGAAWSVAAPFKRSVPVCTRFATSIPAEDLLLSDDRPIVHVGEDRRLDEPSAGEMARTASACHQLTERARKG
jgi:hypothetical protein